MIAYILFALVATPILGVPLTENVPVEHTQKEQQVHQTPVEAKPQTLSVQYPYGQVTYPNVPFYTRKTESGAVEVPLTPDAIVIPYNYPSHPYYQGNYQQYYPNVASRYQTPQYPYQYNQYPYVPESFLVVPVPNFQRQQQQQQQQQQTSPVSYHQAYDNTPRLLYYLPKAYYPTGYQTPIHQSEQNHVEGQEVSGKGVGVVTTQGEGVVGHGQTVYETTKQVEGTQQQ